MAGSEVAGSEVPGGAAAGVAGIDDVVALIERQRAEGLHAGAQLYVSLWGEVVCDVAVGEARAGRALRSDDLMLWYSSTKPLTAVAVAQLLERGALALDDEVGRYVAGWGGGKERCTVRHVLTHMGGFAQAETFDDDISWDEAVARIAAHRAAYPPGTWASYHATSGWKILGRSSGWSTAVPSTPTCGRRSWRRQAWPRRGWASPWPTRLAWASAWCRCTGPATSCRSWPTAPSPCSRTTSRTSTIGPGTGPRWNRAPEDGARPRTSVASTRRSWSTTPSGSSADPHPRPAHRLPPQRGPGPDLPLQPPWGLGVQIAGSMSGTIGYRAFGHSGMASSRGLCDPVEGLVMVFVCNGLTGPIENRNRMTDVTNAVYAAVCPQPKGPRVAPAVALS